MDHQMACTLIVHEIQVAESMKLSYASRYHIDRLLWEYEVACYPMLVFQRNHWIRMAKRERGRYYDAEQVSRHLLQLRKARKIRRGSLRTVRARVENPTRKLRHQVPWNRYASPEDAVYRERHTQAARRVAELTKLMGKE